MLPEALYPERRLLHVVHESALQRPALPALLFKGAHLPYRELDPLTDALAAFLVA